MNEDRQVCVVANSTLFLPKSGRKALTEQYQVWWAIVWARGWCEEIYTTRDYIIASKWCMHPQMKDFTFRNVQKCYAVIVWQCIRSQNCIRFALSLTVSEISANLCFQNLWNVPKNYSLVIDNYIWSQNFVLFALSVTISEISTNLFIFVQKCYAVVIDNQCDLKIPFRFALSLTLSEISANLCFFKFYNKF